MNTVKTPLSATLATLLREVALKGDCYFRRVLNFKDLFFRQLTPSKINQLTCEIHNLATFDYSRVAQ